MNTEKYIDAVFGYCIKRLNNIEDAKDLSQEILFEVIKSQRNTPVRDMDAWVWKIAHNRYARFIGNKKVNYISFDDSGLIETLTDEIAENTDDELKAVFSAIHSLALSHRSILVDYYISELTYQQMADKYSLPVGTIKTRLFYGKQKLKERWQFKMDNIKFYEKINWFLFGNGDIDLSYIERQIIRAIVSACYEKALNIEEISLATGLPCMYY